MKAEPNKLTQFDRRSPGRVSILALDGLQTPVHLTPGVPYEIAAGVSISILQSAAEALLEVERAAEAVYIDQQKAVELATVKPGQVINAGGGRYVLLRHLQALIVPREPGYERPDSVQQAIKLALATLQEQDLLDAKKRPSRALSSKRQVRLALLGTGIAALIGLYFLPTPKDPQQKTSAGAAPDFVALSPKAAGTPGTGNLPIKPEADSATGADKLFLTDADGDGSHTAPAPKLDASSAHETPSREVTNRGEAKVSDDQLTQQAKVTQAAKSPEKSSPAPKSKKSVKPAKSEAPEVAGNVSEKTRQRILEFKLQGRFDHTKAKEKLHEFVESLPKGSVDRSEAEKAYSRF